MRALESLSGRWRSLAGRTRVVFAVAIVGAAGFAGVAALGHPNRGPAVGEGSAPQAADGGRPVPTQAGAVDAAVRSATVLARLFGATEADATAVVSDLASDGYRQAMVASVASDLLPLQRQAAALAGRSMFRQSVLATRVDSFSPQQAVVSVWLVLVAGQLGEPAPPAASFTTLTLRVVWERQAWRLDGTSQVTGPSPALADPPSSADQLAQALAGFADWRPA